MHTFLLELVGPHGPLARLRLRPDPVHVGRAPTNDLVLDDPLVSGRHLAAWSNGERVWVEDLHSRNGSEVSGRPLRGVAEVAEGDEIRLGADVVLRVTRAAALPVTRRWLLEDLSSGARFAVRADRFRLGPEADADVILDQGPGAILLIDAEGGLQLARDDDEVSLDEGAIVEAGGRRLRVVLATDEVARTEELAQVWYPYRVEVSLEGPGGPAASVVDPAHGRRHTVEAANRAVLMYLMARTMRDDTRRAAQRAERGWCDDEEVARGIWGKAGPERQLKVLVCRLRAELREAGFDPWVVEKRRGAIRLRTDDVIVA